MKNNRIPGAVNIFMAIACLLVIATNCAVIFLHVNVITVVGAIEALICCAFAGFYAARGYEKAAAPAYKLFMILVFLNYQLGAGYAGVQISGIAAGVVAITQCLIASCALALALSHDMGRRMSLTLCAVMFVVTLATLITIFAAKPGMMRGGSAIGSTLLFRAGANHFLSIVAAVMTVAKYMDKAARGMK